MVSTGDCDDSVVGKVNFSSNTELGKFFGDEYKHKLKGHTILPHNLKNEVLQTGFNAQVSGEYKYDVVFTNLHTDTIDNTNNLKNAKNIEVLPISTLMGEAIKRISNSTSVSDLFK